MMTTAGTDRARESRIRRATKIARAGSEGSEANSRAKAPELKVQRDTRRSQPNQYAR